MKREHPRQTNYKSQTDDILSLSSCYLVCAIALFLSFSFYSSKRLFPSSQQHRNLKWFIYIIFSLPEQTESLVIRHDNLKYMPVIDSSEFQISLEKFTSSFFFPDLSITKITIKPFFITLRVGETVMLDAFIIRIVWWGNN